jgi:hypothetical protein
MQLANHVGGQLHAVRHLLFAVCVVATAGGFAVQQFTGQLGVGDFVGVFVFKFDQATQATAVTEGFPLGCIELIKGVLRPKLWTERVGHQAKPPV